MDARWGLLGKKVEPVDRQRDGTLFGRLTDADACPYTSALSTIRFDSQYKVHGIFRAP